MTAAGDWVCYKTVFSAEAPIHIGWHRLGLIERTRYYIPARAVWGTIIAAMAPLRFPASGVPAMYEKTTSEFAQCMRFTCFFAAPAVDSEVWRPKYHSPQGLMYGNLSAADFESRFVFSQTSAALDPSTFTALDGALHESEYLCFTNGSSHPGALHFTGYLIFKEWLAIDLAKALAIVSIGAERNYGWGRLHLRHFQKTTEPLFGEFHLTADPVTAPSIRASSGAFLPAHVRHQPGKTNFAGELELLGGREWATAAGSGRDLGKLALCWAPGSKVPDTETTFEIGGLGIWNAL